MNERLTRLEVEFEHVRKDLDDIKGDIKSILTQVADQPTTTNLWTMGLTGIGIALAMIAIFVGVLTYLMPLAK